MTNDDLIYTSEQLSDIRDKAKLLLKEKYTHHMRDLGKILTMTAEREKKSPLEVAVDVCVKKSLIGMDLLLIMAAAVELTDQSGSKP